MTEHDYNTTACEPAADLTYGMSQTLCNSGLLSIVGDLSQEDKACLVRYIRQTDDLGQETWEGLDDNLPPYTLEELNARIDEAEEEIDRGGGKSFEEMMDGFKQQLLWLK